MKKMKKQNFILLVLTIFSAITTQAQQRDSIPSLLKEKSMLINNRIVDTTNTFDEVFNLSVLLFKANEYLQYLMNQQSVKINTCCPSKNVSLDKKAFFAGAQSIRLYVYDSTLGSWLQIKDSIITK